MTTSFQIFPGITSIASNFKGVLLDAFGVFWGGNRVGLLPGAKEAMRRLMLQGKIVGILSNATQRAEKEKLKLYQAGLVEGEHFHFIMTSGEVVHSIFKQQQLPFPTPNQTFWLFGEPHAHYPSHRATFEGTVYSEVKDIKEADFIYISVPHLNGEEQTDPEAFREAVQAIKNFNLPMVCPNPDKFAQEGQPPVLFVKQGSIAALYEEMGGRVFYIGKPFTTAYQAAMHYFHQYGIRHPTDVLMVGDTPETDARGAHQFGMNSVLVTQTGVLAERIRQTSIDQALQDIHLNDYPHYFIEQLADR